MKDVFAAFGSEVFRPLVTLAIPGALAMAPYYILVRVNYPDVNAIAAANGPENLGFVIVAAIFVGLILDDVGSRVEVGFDKLRGWMNPSHLSNWNSYLRLAFSTEPVGHRYLRNKVMGLEFELHTAIAFLVTLPGLCHLLLAWTPDRTTWAWFIGSIVAAALYLLWEAWGTHGVLSETRATLLKGIINATAEPPLTAPKISAPVDVRGADDDDHTGPFPTEGSPDTGAPSPPPAVPS